VNVLQYTLQGTPIRPPTKCYHRTTYKMDVRHFWGPSAKIWNP